MKTFLKVMLILVAVVLAIKLLPLALGLACAIAGGIAVLVVAGLSLMAGLVGAAMLLALVLSPIWLPLLALVGVIALIRKLSRSSPRAGV